MKAETTDIRFTAWKIDEEHACEVYCYLGKQWDVTAAKEILMKDPDRPVYSFDASVFGQAAASRPRKDGTLEGLDLFKSHVDWNRIDSGCVFLDVPVIVGVEEHERDGETVLIPVLLDGWHRVAKATEEGKRCLMVILDVEETDAIKTHDVVEARASLRAAGLL